MTAPQIATNAAAVRNLAARLERLGYTGDCNAEAEAIAAALIADGYRELDKPVPMRGPGGSEAARRAARRHLADVLAGRKRNNPTPLAEESA